MATVEAILSKVWVETLAPGIRDALIEQDTVFSEIRSTSMGVAPVNEIGRDWTAKHQYITGLAGKLTVGAVTGDTIIGAGTEPATRFAGTPATYPALSGMIMPGYVNTAITLKRWKGNTFIPSHFLRADTLSSLITDSSAAIVKQTARMVAAWKANLFFSTDTTHRSIGTIGATVTDGGVGDTTVTFDLASGSRIRRFQPGMEVDIWLGSGPTVRNSAALYVHSVDPLNNTVIVKFVDGATLFTTQVATGDIVTLRSSRTYGPSGLENWLISSGTLLGGIALATYPQFKSYVVSNLGHSLTEQDLRKWVGGFIDAYGPGKAPDTLLTTQGVINAYVGETDDAWQYNLQGQPLRKEGGFVVGEYNYNGRVLQWRIGALVAGGKLYGIRLKNNFRRYTTPRLPNTGRNGYFNGDIEFVAPLGGVSGIWMHALYNDGVTDWHQAPFESIEEYAPEVPQGVNIAGITEETIF